MNILGNKLDFKTFSFLRVNDTEIEIPSELSLPYGLESNITRNSEFELFNDMDYGVSPEAVKINEENGNLYRCFSTDRDEDRDFGVLKLTLDDENPVLLDTIDILANENSKLKLIIDYSSKDGRYFRSSLIRIIGKKNSNVDVFIIQRDSFESKVLESIGIYTEENSVVNVSQYELGSHFLYGNYRANVVGESSKANVDSIYFGKGDSEINLLYNIDHIGERTKSEIVVNGALKDNSYKNFKSNLNFIKGAKKSVGSEEEFVMLLDEGARSVSVPLLLCSEEDVEGNHAASAGRIDQDVLFYIMSRGYSLKDAEAIIVESKFSSAIDRLDNEGLEEELWNRVNLMVEGEIC